jgi:hypothetical protein
MELDRIETFSGITPSAVTIQSFFKSGLLKLATAGVKCPEPADNDTGEY